MQKLSIKLLFVAFCVSCGFGNSSAEATSQVSVRKRNIRASFPRQHATKRGGHLRGPQVCRMSALRCMSAKEVSSLQRAKLKKSANDKAQTHKAGKRYQSPARVARRRRRMRWLNDIRYESQGNYTRIVLLVSGVVHIEQGEARAVVSKNLPARIYVDMTPCVPVRRLRKFPLLVGDKRVHRVRVARNTRRTTRVVLDLKRFDRARVTILSEPVRIVIDLSNGRLPTRPNSLMKLPTTRPKVVSGQGGPGRAVKQQGGKGTLPYVLRYRGNLKFPFQFKVGRIAIDPGHGGREDGAIGRSYGVREKHVTLDISKRVIKLLKKGGVDAFLTRKKDRTLSILGRAKVIKKKKADLLVSIHINSHPSRELHGVSTFFLHWNDRFRASQLLSSNPLLARENQGVHIRRFRDVDMILNGLRVQNNTVLSRLLAVCVQRGMMSRIKRQYKIRNLGVRRGLFYLLFAAGVPGVLVEASFVSNKAEEKLLRTSKYRRDVAKGIADGIFRFVKMSKRSSK
ncbi:MAG TPA: hypothetical protein DCE42_16865 [Myxococcales bacterium]|nr:hypothetical protein [Deltaproteobacteria bacterium]MBU48349.1 hypothetical protein [Deltaproteobacteria bacterium]HAA56440.1 hypothetical protein [Myxococcales bacterium]